MDGENPNGRLDWGLVSERVGLRLKQEYGAENWNCLAVLPIHIGQEGPVR